MGLSWSSFTDPLPAVSPRQKSGVTTPLPPFVLNDNIRWILGNNPHLSDNKLVKSWQYVIWMVAYCVTCTLFGLLSVTLLPDPATLELIRNGGGVDDYDDMAAAAQSMSTAYGEMVDTEGYMEGYKGQSVGSQETGNGGGAQESGSQDTISYSGVQREPGYAMQDTIVQANAVEYSKKKTEGNTNKYKGSNGAATNHFYDHWLKQYNKQKNHYTAASPDKLSAEEIPPTSHYKLFQSSGGSYRNKPRPVSPPSQESSYTSYSNQQSSNQQSSNQKG